MYVCVFFAHFCTTILCLSVTIAKTNTIEENNITLIWQKDISIMVTIKVKTSTSNIDKTLN